MSRKRGNNQRAPRVKSTDIVVVAYSPSHETFATVRRNTRVVLPYRAFKLANSWIPRKLPRIIPPARVSKMWFWAGHCERKQEEWGQRSRIFRNLWSFTWICNFVIGNPRSWFAHFKNIVFCNIQLRIYRVTKRTLKVWPRDSIHLI